MNENLIAGNIYLDNAATTQLDEEVLNEMIPYLTSAYGNASSTHPYGIQARMAIEKSRKTIASLLGVKPANIIFTSGGTESNNTAVVTAVRDLGCDHIITSKLEHHAVLHPIEYYAAKHKIEISYVKLYSDGTIDQNDLRKLLEKKDKEGYKCFVSLMHANNETGQFTEFRWIGDLCKKHKAIFHSDCVQTIGHFPINLSKVGVHLASASAHKFHGPKGIGLLFVHDDLHISPLIFGGAQEKGYRAGTENVAGIVGMAKALYLAHEHFTKDQLYISEIKQYLTDSIKTNYPDVIINTGRFSLYSVLSVSFPKNEQTESLLSHLHQKRICASGGSACSGGGSHVMKELGRSEKYVTIRFSFSKYNTKEELAYVADILCKQLKPTYLEPVLQTEL